MLDYPTIIKFRCTICIKYQGEAQVHPVIRISFRFYRFNQHQTTKISCFSFVLAGLDRLSHPSLLLIWDPTQAQPFIFFNEDY
jgi:hypothetical protein